MFWKGPRLIPVTFNQVHASALNKMPREALPIAHIVKVCAGEFTIDE